jgi:hypothetical protein
LVPMHCFNRCGAKYTVGRIIRKQHDETHETCGKTGVLWLNLNTELLPGTIL